MSALDLQNRVSEVDSDMADITEELEDEGDEEEGDEMTNRASGLEGERKWAGESARQDAMMLSASSHIASSLGINPHTLQVGLPFPNKNCIPSIERHLH